MALPKVKVTEVLMKALLKDKIHNERQNLGPLDDLLTKSGGLCTDSRG